MQIKIFDQQGLRHDFPHDRALPVMEMIRDQDISIAAQCGGSASCATRHVYVDQEWLGRLPSPQAFEIGMLEFALDPKPDSRLSRQLQPGPSLDGLVVTLGPGTEFWT